jgi:hypothetical protein
LTRLPHLLRWFHEVNLYGGHSIHDTPNGWFIMENPIGNPHIDLKTFHQSFPWGEIAI